MRQNGFFSPKNHRGMTLESLKHRHMKSSSRHNPNRKKRRLVRCCTNEFRKGGGLRGRGSTEGMSMLQLLAFGRSLRLLALATCSAAIAVSATPAFARSHRSAGRHARAYHAGHYARRHYADRHHRHYRRAARSSRWDRGVAQMQAGGLANSHASIAVSASQTTAAQTAATSGIGFSNIVAKARAVSAAIRPAAAACGARGP